MRKRLLAGLLALIIVGGGLTVAWMTTSDVAVAVRPITAVAADSTLATSVSLNQSITDSGQAAVKAAIAAAGPAVVRIDVTATVSVNNPYADMFGDRFFQYFFNVPQGTTPQEREAKAMGSGIVIAYGDEKLILTNAHVVAQANTITVTDVSGNEWGADVVGSDEMLDVASRPTEEIIHADDIGAAGEKPVTQMRSKKARSAGNQNSLFEMHGVVHPVPPARRPRFEPNLE